MLHTTLIHYPPFLHHIPVYSIALIFTRTPQLLRLICDMDKIEAFFASLFASLLELLGVESGAANAAIQVRSISEIAAISIKNAIPQSIDHYITLAGDGFRD
jgi:hypothetical protein